MVNFRQAMSAEKGTQKSNGDSVRRTDEKRQRNNSKCESRVRGQTAAAGGFRVRAVFSVEVGYKKAEP